MKAFLTKINMYENNTVYLKVLQEVKISMHKSIENAKIYFIDNY